MEGSGNPNKRVLKRTSINARMIKAIRAFESSDAHDAFASLLKHKAGLLIDDLKLLSGDNYETSDVREAVFLLQYLFGLPSYREIDIAYGPLGRESLSSTGLVESSLINCSKSASVDGKSTRMLFLLGDWVHSLAGEESSALVMDLLRHNVRVALAPKQHAPRVIDGMFAVFHDQNQPRCTVKFLLGPSVSESPRLTVTYDLARVRDHDGWFNTLWAMTSVRHGKVL